MAQSATWTGKFLLFFLHKRTSAQWSKLHPQQKQLHYAANASQEPKMILNMSECLPSPAARP